MRFLLHAPKDAATRLASEPSKRRVISHKLRNRSERLPDSSPSTRIAEHSDHYRCQSVSNSNVVDNVDDRSSSTISKTEGQQQRPQSPANLLWGQQCSNNCGCVVRFEAKVRDDGSGTIEHFSYHAKQIVTKFVSRPESNRNGQKNSPQLAVQLTRQGRPMMQECQCKSLHKLSQAVIQNAVKQRTISNVRSMLEFQNTRSTPAFCRSALRAQGLPETDSHCLDVVEEAFTALCKGYLPSPRRMPVVPVTKAYGATNANSYERRTQRTGAQYSSYSSEPSSSTTRYYYGGDTEDDDHYHFLRLGHSWRDADPIWTDRAATTTNKSAESSGTKPFEKEEHWLLTTVLDTLEYLQFSKSTSQPTTEEPEEKTTSPQPHISVAETMTIGDHQPEKAVPLIEPWAAVSSDWVSYIDEKNGKREKQSAPSVVESSSQVG